MTDIPEGLGERLELLARLTAQIVADFARPQVIVSGAICARSAMVAGDALAAAGRAWMGTGA